MDEELRRKEREAFQRTFAAYKQHESTGLWVPPEDVGDGWRKLKLPENPMFRNATAYQKDCDDGFLNLMIERRPIGMDDAQMFATGRWHLSISHNRHGVGIVNRPGRMPTWDEIHEVRYKFLPPDVNMAIMLPPQSLYYNRHPTCLHLLEVPVSLALDPKQKGGI